MSNMMDTGQSAQAGISRSDFTTSPSRETRTRAVREYEQTIDQLRKENFDLKLKIFLIEEKRKCQSDETDTTVDIVLDLKVQNESLSLQLQQKDEALQEALQRVEESALELNQKEEELRIAIEQAERYQSELEEKAEEFRNALKAYPSTEEFAQMHEEYSAAVNNKNYLNELIEERNQEIEAKNQEIDLKNQEIEEMQERVNNLISENKTLEDKVLRRSQAIRGCVMRYKEDVNMPSQIRTLVKAAIEAAQKNDKEKLVSAVENLQLSLCQIMPEPTNVFDNSLFRSRSSINSRNKDSSEISLPTSVSSQMVPRDVRKTFHIPK